MHQGMNRDRKFAEYMSRMEQRMNRFSGIPSELLNETRETAMAMRDPPRDPREMAISSDRNDPRYPNRPKGDVNPRNEPTGHFTGRCGRCGAKDLWDDNSAYGCNNCGAVYQN